eukprot:1155504-Pelagomonas_calceolata.AAC.1
MGATAVGIELLAGHNSDGYAGSTTVTCLCWEHVKRCLFVGGTCPGCQSHIISSMNTERHNVAGRMVIKAHSKSPWGAGLVHTDIGSYDRLVQHNRQIPAHASNKVIPLYLFPRNFSQRSRLTSGRPDALLINPYKSQPL